MGRVICFSFACILFFSGCEKIEIDRSAPECIKDKIRSFARNEFTCDEGAHVSQYLFMDQNVYVFDQGICGADMAAQVYSESCEKLGLLGGFAGNTTINGVSFSEAVFIKLIWEK